MGRKTAVTTVNLDEQGRCYIPKPAREKLGIEGESLAIEVEIRVDD